MSQVVRHRSLPTKFYVSGATFMGGFAGVEITTETWSVPPPSEHGAVASVLLDTTVEIVPNALVQPEWTEVPSAPPNAETYSWDGGAWVEDAGLEALAKSERAGSLLATPVNLALRDVILDFENRLRALEGGSPVDKPQVTATLKTMVEGYE